MMNGLSIRKTETVCGIHRNTAFLWRHRVLDALQNMADDVTLNGIIETGRVSTKDLHHIYNGRIEKNSAFVTDKMNSYVRFTNSNGIELVQSKRILRGFNGVSAKYLNSNLLWNNLVYYAKETDTEKRNIFLTFVLAALKTDKCKDLSKYQQFLWSHKI